MPASLCYEGEPPMTSINSQIEQRVRPVVEERVRAFIAELTDELSVLVRQTAADVVSQALVGAEAPTATPAPAPHRKSMNGKGRGPATAAQGQPARAKATNGKAAKAATKTRVRRSPEQLASAAKRLRDYVQKNPGQRIEEIATGLKCGTKELQRPMKQLVDEKAIRREGEKRASRYFSAGAAKKGTTKRKSAGRKSGTKKAARKGGNARARAKK